jgi:16S rRNA (cytidine1402-2'-O)-methyltransferase
MGTLHVVATPIGHLEDISLRALRVLSETDWIYAEDTRRTRILLDRHRIAARPLSLNSHNEEARIGEALARLRAGDDIALVSDAGTPLVSDPGGRLVEAAIEDGHAIDAVPGASALLAALTVSGVRAQPFSFLGFLPRKSGARRRLIESFRGRAETLVFFESPRRVGTTLAELAELLGPRRACLARELTKLHEEVARGRLPELAERFAEGARGEVTLVVEGAEGAEGEPAAPGDLDSEIRLQLQAGRRPREIAARLAPATGVPRREIYGRALALSAESAEEAGS